MPNYTYEAEHISGRKSEGVIPAQNESEARSKLQNLDLRVLKIEEKKDSLAVPEKNPGLYAYEFQGERVDNHDQHKVIAGVIDAPDREHALDRLRDEFRLVNIVILSEQAIKIKKPELSERSQIEKDVQDFMSGGQPSSKPATKPHTIYNEVISFLSWLLFFEVLYYFYAILAQIYPLGMSASSAAQVVTGSLFLYTTAILFILFASNEIYHRWCLIRATLRDNLAEMSLYFLIILGSTTIYLLFTGNAINIISNLLAMPLATVLVLFLFTQTKR